MSAASVQAGGQYASIPGIPTAATTTSSYPPNSVTARYPDSQAVNAGNRHTNEARGPSGRPSQQRTQRTQNPTIDPNPAYAQYYSSQGMSDDSQYMQSLPQETQNLAASTSAYNAPMATAIPYHTRQQPSYVDQYDGAPVPPPRTSSQQQQSLPNVPIPPSTSSIDPRTGATRPARQADSNLYNQGNQAQAYTHEYSETPRERPRDDITTTTGSGGRSRRKGPSSPEGPHRATSTRERGQHSNAPTQSRSEAAMIPMSTPAPLMRENSEVIDRVIVSDPQVDVQRMQERVAEAQPHPIDSDGMPTSGMALGNHEAVEDAGRGPARRQDYSKSSSRRKDVQFGDYILGQTLGEGEFGKVKLGWKKDGSSQVAIKLIRRETVATNPSRLPKIYREISILQDLTHPNIVRLHEKVETERHIGIILEYASGGELFDYILNHRYLKDPAAKRLFSQLVSGVGYLHKKGIVHRDLKLENLLLDQNRNIIITDFGFANTFNPADELSDEIVYQLTNRDFVRKYKLDRLDANGMRRGDLMQTSCGSPCYAAPELVVSDSLYTGKKVDVWSCGVILYAMLAGYLPFDDDPANPEGDNINLLYKYITTTPLTFPEYVSPHARDLLRRILVPDPRKRADLFEVARHSWLADYHHLVFQYTSSTTNINDINNSLLSLETGHDAPGLNRSASVREQTKTTTHPSPGLRLARTPEVTTEGEQETSSSRRERMTRHTLQPEYVAPQTHTIRGPPPATAAPVQKTSQIEHPAPTTTSIQQPSLSTKPLPQEPPQEKMVDPRQAPVVHQKMAPPIRPARDVPRAVSDSTGAFASSANAPPNTQQQVTRPSTRGSVTSASGPTGTRSDLRLPSRGSYGQPVAPSVAATNAQGRVTQPSKSSRAYNISGPVAQHGTHNSIGQPMTQSMPPAGSPQPQKSHHRRSSTLSGLGERLFGRSSSVRKSEAERQKNSRKYPPTSMKESYPADIQPRMSSDSKRSTFGLGKKRSTDMESQNEKPARRFSLIPSSMSFKGLMGGSKEPVPEPDAGRPADYNMSPSNQGTTYSQRSTPSKRPGTDSQPDESRPARYNNFSRPPQAQYRQAPPPAMSEMAAVPNDVYGGTGVYAPQGPGYNSHYRQQSQPLNQSSAQYSDGSADQPRPSMQGSRQGRTVLTKPNRKFTDAYDNEQGPNHHGGSSGAVKKVQDFFRRRGRARADSDYR